MDPTTTLRQLLDAITDDDRELAEHLIHALLGWMAAGGFLPTVTAMGDNLFEVRRESS